MATLEQLEMALINADRAGAADDARALARAISDMRQSQAPRQKISTDPGKPYSALEGMSRFEKVMAGAGKRAMDVVTLGMRDAPESDKELMKDGWAIGGGAATDIASLVGGGAALRAAGSLPAFAKGLPAAANWIRGLGQSAIAPKSIADAASVGMYYGAATAPGGLAERAKSGAEGAVGGAIGQGLAQGIGAGVGALRNMSGQGKISKVLSETAGMKPEELAERIRAGDVTLVPGARPTTTQAAMVPNVSQLERTLRNKNANAFTQSDEAQDVARRAFMGDRLGVPWGQTAREAAENAGDIIGERSTAARNALRAETSRAYKSVDPEGSSRLAFPMKEADEALRGVFGPGAGAPGAELSSLIGDAKALTATKSDILSKAKTAKGVADFDKHSLSDAVRIWGGINSKRGGGEAMALRETDVARSRSGLGSLVSGKGKLTWERAAEKAYEDGYIPDGDLDTFMRALFDDANGSPVFSQRMSNSGFESLARRDDVPENLVSWEAAENLRKRAGEIVRAAKRDPKMGRDAVVAGDIRRLLDDQMGRASGGQLLPGEYFPAEMQQQATMARSLAKQKIDRFDTGPSAGIFRTGSDGLPVRQGAEIPRAFVNSKDSQLADVQQLMKMAGGDQQQLNAARQYAMADLAEYAAKDGKAISPAKFDDWTKKRKPMLDALFPDNKVANIEALRDDLLRSQKALNLGRATGSNTAQNLAGGGAFQRFAVDSLLGRVPFVGRPVAGLLNNASEEALMKRLTPAMLNPDIALEALRFGAQPNFALKYAPIGGLLGIGMSQN
jgi:hypothetical protein